MKIYRSSNTPIIITFDIDVNNVKDMLISLYWDNNYPVIIQQWNKSELIIQGKYLAIPLKQTETANYPIGMGHLDVKWVDNSGFVYDSSSFPIEFKLGSSSAIIGGDIDYSNISLEELANAQLASGDTISSIKTNIAMIDTCDCVPDEGLTIEEIISVLD